jgi:biopolymer transport protein ExbD
MSHSSRQRDSFSEINITPLTDIFLVLLIIMMVIAPLLDQQGLNLTVPSQHEAQKQEQQPKIITINVTKDGQYTLDGQTVAANSLQSRIEEAYKVKKEGLLIRADQESTHGAVVQVMDAAQQVGVQNVSVMEN